MLGGYLERYGRLRSIHWGVALNIILAWVLTLPGAGMLAALAIGIIGALGSDTGGTLSVGLVAAHTDTLEPYCKDPAHLQRLAGFS